MKNTFTVYFFLISFTFVNQIISISGLRNASLTFPILDTTDVKQALINTHLNDTCKFV